MSDRITWHGKGMGLGVEGLMKQISTASHSTIQVIFDIFHLFKDCNLAFLTEQLALEFKN